MAEERERPDRRTLCETTVPHRAGRYAAALSRSPCTPYSCRQERRPLSQFAGPMCGTSDTDHLPVGRILPLELRLTGGQRALPLRRVIRGGCRAFVIGVACVQIAVSVSARARPVVRVRYVWRLVGSARRLREWRHWAR